jgi:hypothetical protein
VGKDSDGKADNKSKAPDFVFPSFAGKDTFPCSYIELFKDVIKLMKCLEANSP